MRTLLCLYLLLYNFTHGSSNQITEPEPSFFSKWLSLCTALIWLSMDFRMLCNHLLHSQFLEVFTSFPIHKTKLTLLFQSLEVQTRNRFHIVSSEWILLNIKKLNKYINRIVEGVTYVVLSVCSTIHQENLLVFDVF